ncbi:MAG: V-type ATPase subunit [Sulfuricaulis sp.]
MPAIARQAYLHSRVSVMAGRLLSDESMYSLIESPLEQGSQIFQTAGVIGLHAEQPSEPPFSLEQQLVAVLLADFVILVRPLSGAARKFFIYWAYRFELSNLKTILRGKIAGQLSNAIQDQLVNMGPFATLPIEELLRTEDVAEMLRLLERTPFAEIAREARRIYEEHHELFSLDAAVDRRYYASLNKQAQEIKGYEGRLLQSLIGSIIDRSNLMWLLRYRFAYGLPPAEAYYLLIPAGERLKGHHLLALSQLNSFKDVIEQLPAPFADLLAGASSPSEVTQILERETWHISEKILKRTSFNLARAFAYLILREKDLRQLRAIIKGRRAEIHSEIIREAAGLTLSQDV